MSLRFVFLLITRRAAWVRLSRRKETWKTAEILILRHQLAVLQRPQPHRPKLNWADRVCVPNTLSTSCDQAIFVDQATDASVSSAAVLVEDGRLGQRFQRRGAVQGAVRPMLIVVGLILVQDPPQLVLVPDEGAVQELAAASADPAFGDRVHAGRPDVAEHGPDASISENRVERGREVRAAVADHELDSARLLAEVHEQVAGLLGGPRPGGMQRQSEDADAQGRVLDHGRT